MRRLRVLGTVLFLVVIGALVPACGQQEVAPEPTIIRLPAEDEPELVAPTCTPTATTTATPQPEPEAPDPTSTPTPTTTPRPSTAAAPQVPSTTTRPPLEGQFVFQVASGGDIYMVNADGTGLTRLTWGMDPSWSPDGSQVAFVRWTTPWGIYTINADGSSEKVLFSSNVARAPVWSPDGSQLAFYFETEGWTAPWRECFEGLGCLTLIPAMLQQEWHLGVVDVADGYLHQPYCDRSSFSPTWSREEGRLIYDGDHGLSTTTVEGPNNQPFTDNVHDAFPVLSPDGGRIAFMHWQHDHWEIYMMNADGSGRRPLTGSSALLERRPNNVSPAWSPDGQQLVFLSDRGGDGEFYVMNADGSDQRQILDDVTAGMEITYQGAYERVISWGSG